MKVRVEYLAQLRDAVGQSDEEIDFLDAGTVLELLAQLAARFGGDAAPHLIDASGKPQRGLLTVVNDQAVPASAAASTVLKPGDRVTLMPPIAGG